MVKNKYAGIAACLSVLVLIGAVVWLFYGHQKNGVLGQKVNSLQSASADASGTSGPPSQNIPLNQAPVTPDASSGLSVSPSTPTNSLGQLGNSQSQAGASSSPGSSSSSPASFQPFDPSTFAQYDKYKNSQNALFGEAQVGTGTELTANHKAAVYYRGWLTNGQLFDESRAGSDGKLQPFVFTLGAHQVIPGWEQALNSMKVGGVRLVIVPPAVGYGASGQGSIPPNAVLIFQVQLLGVQ